MTTKNEENNIYFNNDKKINDAFEILEINIKEISHDKLNKEYLKKKYHKMALKWHPDKNADDLENATENFKKINDAYYYLINNLNENDTNNQDEININQFCSNGKMNLYQSMLLGFLKLIINGDNLLNILQEIILNTDNTFTENILDNIDLNTSINIYNLLCKYRDVFHIKNELLFHLSNIIKKKYENEKIIILKTTINDLWENNVYKLIYDDDVYLVPLWHNELHFENKENKDLIVLCNPELPENVTIDENNNIIVKINISVINELHDLLNNNCDYKFVDIGCKNFAIPLNKLMLKKCQIFKFKGQGISQINDLNMYDIRNKSDVIFYINLF